MGSSALKERKIYSILGGILFSLIHTGVAEDISLKEARSILVKNSQDSNQQRISQLLQFYVSEQKCEISIEIKKILIVQVNRKNNFPEKTDQET